MQVEKLSDSANQLVTYIDDTIMPDYDSFVKTGEQYRTDATYVNSTMDHFEERANSLKEIVLVMKQSVEDISTGGLRRVRKESQMLRKIPISL